MKAVATRVAASVLPVTLRDVVALNAAVMAMGLIMVVTMNGNGIIYLPMATSLS